MTDRNERIKQLKLISFHDDMINKKVETYFRFLVFILAISSSLFAFIKFDEAVYTNNSHDFSLAAAALLFGLSIIFHTLLRMFK